MKQSFSHQLLIILMVSLASGTIAQDLDLSQYDLKAHYPLSSNGVDTTGNYGDMTIEVPQFDSSAVLSRGCWGSGNCLINTPQITALNDLSFAIQVDFKIDVIGRPIFQAGLGFRYLGVATAADGTVILKTGSQQEEEITGLKLVAGDWFTVTVVHNTADSITDFYLEGLWLFSKKQYLNHPRNDNIISNTDYSRGRAFMGYWRNLKVYSTNSLTSTEEESNSTAALIIYPNPVGSVLTVKEVSLADAKYQISDLSGRVIRESQLQQNSINIEDILPGTYLLTILDKNQVLRTEKFVKK